MKIKLEVVMDVDLDEVQKRVKDSVHNSQTLKLFLTEYFDNLLNDYPMIQLRTEWISIYKMIEGGCV